MNVNACGATARDGGVCVTVSVTGTDSGVFEAPAEVIWTLPVYVPALKPAGATEIDNVDVAVPDVGDTFNQVVPDDEVLADAVQASVPLPLFVIWMDCAEGTAPPRVYANCSVPGVTAIVDGFEVAAIMAKESAPLAV